MIYLYGNKHRFRDALCGSPSPKPKSVIPLPPNPATLLVVHGQTGNQEKDPWMDVDPPRGNVEKSFLRPAPLGELIASFRVLPPRESVVPWDTGHGGLFDAPGAVRLWSPRLSATGQLKSTTSSFGALWVSNGRSDLA